MLAPVHPDACAAAVEIRGRPSVHGLFNGMAPKTRDRSEQGSSLPDAGTDRLSTLPDDVLGHMLSFLPAQDAVRTCVLARGWANLWRTATSLRIVNRNLDSADSVKMVLDFVDRLLLLRGGSPLDAFELNLSCLDWDNMLAMLRLNLWIQHVLGCNVRTLTLDIICHDCYVELDGLTFASDHLTKLELRNVQLEGRLLDFSRCPTLEVLEIDESHISGGDGADSIISQSLKCLHIRRTFWYSEYYRSFICAPNLQSLHLEVGNSRCPRLEIMPSLVDAYIELADTTYDFCWHSVDGDCGYEDCSPCYGLFDDNDSCVLLQGLLKAQSLELRSSIDSFVFRRDLKWCPIFGNLKSLLLNEYWCMPGDLSASIYA